MRHCNNVAIIATILQYSNNILIRGVKIRQFSKYYVIRNDLWKLELFVKTAL